MDGKWYCKEGIGRFEFDPKAGTRHFHPWWLLLRCDDEMVRLYAWLMKRHGKPAIVNSLWGAHVSVVKGEEPPDKRLWGRNFGPVHFFHTHVVREGNGFHYWLDVHSKQLSDIRVALGLEPKERYHLTIGRRDHGCDDGC